MLLILLLCSLQAAATSVLPVSLQRMATTAAIIFHGTAISNEVKLDQASGRVATYTTFKVNEVIKGDPGTTHTIKQIGGQLPGSNVRQLIHGVPQFAVSQEYVIFLPKASSMGFSSPIGLSQGKFDIRKLNGETMVSNGRASATMTKAAPQQALTKTPSAIEASQLTAQPAGVRLADFLQSVRGMLKE
jgi:hypothetical protein